MITYFGTPLLVLSLLASSVFGADKTLSWSELVTKTKENNEELLSSQRNLQSSEYSVKGSYYNYMPQVSASASANRGSTADDYGVALTATQNVFSGFSDAGKVAQNKASYDLAKAALQTTQAKVSYDLKAAVADLVYAQNYVKLAKGIIDRRELNLKMVQLRFDGGRENKGSLLLSKAYLEDARLDFLQATQELSVAQSRIAKILGEEDMNNYVLNGKVPVTVPSETNPDFQKLVLDTPVYKSAIAQEDISKAGVTQSESGFYPSLNLSATTGKSGTSWYPDQDRWSVGASISMPIFNGGRDYFSTRSSLESLKASTLTRSSTLKDQLVKLKDTYVSYVQAVQKLKVDGAYVEAAEAREKISRQKYNNGLSTFDDWDLIESDLIKRQKSLLQSERDRIVSEAAWEQVQGKGVLQ